MSLRRPPTRLELKSDDIEEYEQLKRESSGGITGIQLGSGTGTKEMLKTAKGVRKAVTARKQAARYVRISAVTADNAPLPEDEGEDL